MKKFKFGLETLLRYRQIVQKQHERRLGEAGTVLKVARDELSELRSALDQSYEIGAGAARVDVQASLLSERYRERLTADMDQKRSDVASLQVNFNERREALAKATQEKQVIVKLKDRALAEHRYEVEREQQKLIDEIIATRRSAPDKGKEKS